MRILVTGAAGFTGSHHVRTLLDGGHPGCEGAEVTVVDKLTYAASKAVSDLVAPAYSKIRSELGCAPRWSFDDGLSGVVRWYRDNPGWWKPLLRTTR